MIVDLLALAGLIAIVVIGHRYWSKTQSEDSQVIRPDPLCNLQRSTCTVGLPGNGRLSLGFSHSPVVPIKPFEVNMNLSGMSVDRARIEFSGADMEMGIQHVQLQAKDDGAFIGTARLPVCVTGHMNWRATVLLEQGQQRIAIPFVFTVGD